MKDCCLDVLKQLEKCLDDEEFKVILLTVFVQKFMKVKK